MLRLASSRAWRGPFFEVASDLKFVFKFNASSGFIEIHMRVCSKS